MRRLFLSLTLLALAGCPDDSDSNDQVDASEVDSSEADAPNADVSEVDGSDVTVSDVEADAASESVPVYVSWGTHIELQGVWSGNCPNYLEFRDKLLEVAELFDSYDVAWNIQPTYMFVEQMNRCETPQIRADTNDQNILRYLYDEYDARIDPHGHEGQEDPHGDFFNYTDCFVALRDDADIPADSMTVVGGVSTGDQQLYVDLNAGKAGSAGKGNQDEIWRPLIISFPAVEGHALEHEDYTSGVWMPTGLDYDPANSQDGADYFTPAETGIPISGQGFINSCQLSSPDAYFWQASDYVLQLAAFIEDGTVETGQIYTSTIATTAKQIGTVPDILELYAEQLEELAPLVADGRVVYVHFQDLPDIWESEFDSEPNLLSFEVFEGHETCQGGVEVSPGE